MILESEFEMKKTRNIISFVLTAVMICTNVVISFASDNIDDVVNGAAKYIYNTVKEPQVGSIGGEWAVIGLSRSGYDVPDEYYQNYFSRVKSYVKACEGTLSDKKYTEYSRVVLALTAIGKDPTNVGGYNLLMPLGDYDKTVWQGLNGPVWALIALDSGNYEIPNNTDCTTQATRDMYINKILESQLLDGGFSLVSSGNDQKSDPDMTGMVLQALSKYQDRVDVKEATEKALLCLSKMQSDDGGYSSWGSKNSESTIQVMVALCELGIPIDDERFVKNGVSLLDNILGYYSEENGFSHTNDGSGSNIMASEQGLYGVAAVKRLMEGKNSLYSMSDNLNILDVAENNDFGLGNKNSDIKLMAITNPNVTFLDIDSYQYKSEIEVLASRGIISGKAEGIFDAEATMTRSEFATIIVRALGLDDGDTNQFTDVSVNDWFYKYVNTAYSYGIVSGVSDSEFNPNGTITREEAAVMVARAAKLCGMDTAEISARDILAVFTDYMTVSDWAMDSMAFCYDSKILSDEEIEIKPKQEITRGEIAKILFNMMGKAQLL